jgi:polyphosphate kinase
MYHNRDISWLSFNHRVLQEAKDPSVPLYERIKFLAIYSSNLDEFFRVRVSALRQFQKMSKQERKAMLEVKPKKELRQIKKIVHQQQVEFGITFRSQIIPALRERGIFLLNDQHLFSSAQRQFAREYFVANILPHLQYQRIDGVLDVPFLKNRSLYFVAALAQSDELGLLNIPSEVLPRFVSLPGPAGQTQITFLDEIIRANLDYLFPEGVQAAYSIKISRDAELYIEDEYEGDLMTKIKASLQQRSIGAPTRMLYDSAMNIELTKRLKDIFQLKKNDLFPGGRYHNFSDFFAFPGPEEQANLWDEPLPALPHPVLEGATSILTVLKTQEVLLHFPYQKYDYIPQLIAEAAADPAVESIKITLYRVAKHSSIAQALIRAQEQGKAVTVFVEVKARFDEESNLYWGEQLQNAGATVIYSRPGIKVHSKILLITRREEQGLRHYVYLGTGNFNEKTSTLYTDHALLTAEPKIAAEVADVFQLLEEKPLQGSFQHLMVSPVNARRKFLACIEREITQAKAGQEAWMMLKMNSLEDSGMIDKLYEASQAGVQIRLIVRGICCLVPGVPGLSENIEVISIIDRFLEHGRIYHFANGGQNELYLASADWMTRNLDRRVEVIFPIETPELRRELIEILHLQWADTMKARSINTLLDNPYRGDSAGEAGLRAQKEIYALLHKKLTYNN